MGYEYFTEESDGKKYITGYVAVRNGVDLSDIFLPFERWVDKYGNYKYELLPDGSVVLAAITPTPEQIEERETLDRMEKAQAVLIRIIVKAIKTTSTPLQSWQAIDAALRSLLP